MALVFSGVTDAGRQRFTNPLSNGVGLIVWFPNEPIADVRYKGVVEVLSLNTPLGIYVQKAAYPLWVDAWLIPSSIITNNTHRLSFVWRLTGIPFEVHTT